MTSHQLNEDGDRIIDRASLSKSKLCKMYLFQCWMLSFNENINQQNARYWSVILQARISNMLRVYFAYCPRFTRRIGSAVYVTLSSKGKVGPYIWLFNVISGHKVFLKYNVLVDQEREMWRICKTCICRNSSHDWMQPSLKLMKLQRISYKTSVLLGSLSF